MKTKRWNRIEAEQKCCHGHKSDHNPGGMAGAGISDGWRQTVEGRQECKRIGPVYNRCHLLSCHHLTHVTSAGWVTNHGGTATD